MIASMDPLVVDALRFRIARVLAERNARPGHPRAVGASHGRHGRPGGHEDPDAELWNAYLYVMRELPGARCAGTASRRPRSKGLR